MRILVVSDLYPPASLGGYEVAAREVTDALRLRGHEVWVLTTDALGGWRGDDDGAAGGARPPFAHAQRTERAPPVGRSAPAGRRPADGGCGSCRPPRPDVIFLWNIGGVSHQVVARLMNGPVPTVIYVFGDWPLRKFRTPHDLDPWADDLRAARRVAAGAGWRATALGGVARMRGVATAAAPLRFDHLEYGSRFMMDLLHQSGFLAGGSERLIYYGLFGEYARAAAEPLAPRDPGEPQAVLFVGRLWEAKGVHTVIEALGVLRQPWETPRDAHGGGTRGAPRLRRGPAPQG